MCGCLVSLKQCAWTRVPPYTYLSPPKKEYKMWCLLVCFSPTFFSQSLDPNRLMLLYFSVSGLELLDQLQNVDKAACSRWVHAFLKHNREYGIAGWKPGPFLGLPFDEMQVGLAWHLEPQTSHICTLTLTLTLMYYAYIHSRTHARAHTHVLIHYECIHACIRIYMQTYAHQYIHHNIQQNTFSLHMYPSVCLSVLLPSLPFT